jgi:hypothetical protein
LTDRLVRPIRAWAEYDEWTWMADAATDKVYSIPTSGDGGPFVSQYISVAQAAAEGDMFRPLRSLRVLYENGYELKANRREALPPRPGYINVTWYWYLFPPEIVDGYRVVGQVADGLFPEDKDSEAVERAMIAASAWFTQADPATLGIDSPPPEPAS